MSTQRQRRPAQGVGEVIVLSDNDDAVPAAAVPPRGRASTSRRTSIGRSTRHRSPPRRRPRNPPSSQGGTEAPPDVIDLTGSGDYDDLAITTVRHSGDGLQKRQKVSTPTVGSLSRGAASPESQREPQCAICMEAMRQMASGPCGHVFCEGCLRAAVKAQKRCPSCRKFMQPKQIHRIFLNL